MHSEGLLAPAAAVVRPVGQGTHAGVSTAAAPPPDHLPTGQIAHVEPPYPGAQAADGQRGVGGWQRRSE